MSPALDPMTFDELSELYRVEMKSNGVTPARKDLFRAMANLLTSLRQEYDRQMALDSESVMCEGAEQRRKSAERLVKDILRMRTQKICNMAIHNATGGRQPLDNLTDEERAYYDQVQESTRRHVTEVDRLRGRVRTVDTRIDEIPESRPAPEPEPDLHEEPEPEPVAVPEEAHGETRPEEPPADVPEMFDDEPIPEFDDFPDEPFDEPAPAPAAEAEPAPAPEVREEPVVASEAAPESQEQNGDLEPVIIRVKEDLPEFAGPHRDYKLYKEDVVTLPRVLADILINTDKAVAIRPTP